jgi:hypothetical protein
MRIKEADDKRPQIDALSALLGRPDLAAATRSGSSRRFETSGQLVHFPNALSLSTLGLG